MFNPSFFFQQTPNRLTIYDKRKVNTTLLEIIKNPDKYIERSKNTFKNNSKRTLSIFEIDSKKYLLKRFNYKNLYDWVTKCPFRSSKAYRSWFYAYALEKEGVETINPVALIEKRIGPIWTNTYLITEYIEGKTLDDAFKNEFSPIKISDNIQTILDVFYKNKWLHRDFIGQNILITKKGVTVIDLDEMHSYAFNNNTFKKKFFKKHLVKFLKKNSSPSFIKTFLMTHKNRSDYNFPQKHPELLK